MRPGMPTALLAALAVVGCRTEPHVDGGVTGLLQAELAEGRTPSVQYRHFDANQVLVTYGAGVADVRTGEPVTPRTTYHGFSITKTVTAVAILRLAELGLLGLDDPVVRWLPDAGYPGDITVRHLLTHSAGLANPLPLRWIHLATEHEAFDGDAFFAPVLTRHARAKHPPNQRFAYSNLGYVLLGRIVEEVTGERFEDHVATQILTPLGVTAGELGFTMDLARHAAGHQRSRSVGSMALRVLLDTEKYLEPAPGRWQVFRPLYVNGAAYGGIMGSADGFVRFAQALMDPGRGLLSEESLQVLFTENVLADGRASGMSMAWFTGELDGHRYRAHAGGGGGYYAELRIYPDLGRGSVLLFNRTGMRDMRWLDRVDAHLPGLAAPSGG